MPSSFARTAALTSLAAAIAAYPSMHHASVVAFAPSPSTSLSRRITPLQLLDANLCRRTGSSLLMSKGSGGGTAANRNQKKKRRFLQQAHPIINVPPPPSPARKPTGGTNRSEPAMSNGQTAPEAGNRSGSTKQQQKRGPPLRTNKSIEELEAILEKRWGTADSPSPKKSKYDDDSDFVLSFDNDDDGTYQPQPKHELRGAAVFRNPRNRVLDPWAEEDGVYNDSISHNNKRSDGPSPHKRDDFDTKSSQQASSKRKNKYDRNEAMLNRVRSNQERLSQSRSNKRQQNSGIGAKKDRGRDEYVNVPIDVSQDYYDEDDEGYEDSNDSSHLLRPRPVGGRGKQSSSSGLSGGIFSDRSSSATAGNNNARGKQNNVLKGENRDDRRPERGMRDQGKKRPKRKKSAKSKPLLDDNGKEMFLTLDQAEKIVQGILSKKGDGEGMTASGLTDNDEDDVNQWEDVGITDPTLLSNLQSTTMSCPYPLPVQDKACPSLVSGNDVLISTHTGSGKTLAFLAPIAQRLLIDNATGNNNSNNNQFPKAIIVAPGRELASQIVSVAQELFKETGLTVSMAIGGTPYSRNVENLRKRKPDVVVGTPGRIAELIIGRPGDKGGKMKISALQTVVLDEFDALLQYDAHKEPTMAIMQAIERQHGGGQQSGLQKVLCSATATDMMSTDEKKKTESNLIEEYLRPGYAHASVDDNDLLVTSGVKSKGGAKTTTARVSRTTIHGALHVPHRRLALEAVRKILNTDPVPQQALIFVDSPRRVDIVIEKLAKMDIIAAPLHGGASSGKSDRAQVNKALREGYVGIVVATEMAARGIDAPYLTHVINLDLPTDASHYAHRAGRCGRGGRPGVAVSITCDVREKGVPGRFADELGIEMYNVEAREAKLRIVEG